MIGNLVVCLEDKPESPQVRAYVMVSESATYESTKVVLQIEDKREALMKLALKELCAFRRKYADLEEFTRLFDEIEKLIA